MGQMLVLIRNARLFDPTPRGVVDILVCGREVVAIGPRLDVAMAEVFDVEGAIVTPGIVDAHVHLAGGGGEGGAHTRVPPLQLGQLTGNGVTAAVGLLGTDCTTRSLGELLACARGIETHGVRTWCYTGGYEVPPPTITGSVRGDLVHIDRMIAVGELAISDHRSSQPTFDELVRIAADAHVAGMMTGKAGLLHLHLGDGPRGLDLLRRAVAETELPARTFHPTHCNRNPRLWEEAKAWPGFVDISAFPADGESMSAGAAIIDWVGAGLDPARLTMSSDGGGCLPTFDADGRLEHMDVGSAAGLLEAVRDAVAAGVPLEVALATCTRNVSGLFRLPPSADFLVLDERLHLRSTMAAGRWLWRDGAAVVRGPFEAGPARAVDF